MTWFHTDEYVHFLQTVTPETAEKLSYHGTRCMSVHAFTSTFMTHIWAFVVLVGEDNPAFEGVFEFCSISAGGSICAWFLLLPGKGDVYPTT